MFTPIFCITFLCKREMFIFFLNDQQLFMVYLLSIHKYPFTMHQMVYLFIDLSRVIWKERPMFKFKCNITDVKLQTTTEKSSGLKISI